MLVNVRSVVKIDFFHLLGINQCLEDTEVQIQRK